MKSNNWKLFSIILFVIILLSKDYIFISIERFYFLTILPNNKTNGLVIKSKEISSIDGRGFECTYSYTISGIEYKNEELISVASQQNILLKDVIVLKYNINNPKYATIKDDSTLYKDFFISICLAISFLICIVYWIWLLKEKMM